MAETIAGRFTPDNTDPAKRLDTDYVTLSEQIAKTLSNRRVVIARPQDIAPISEAARRIRAAQTPEQKTKILEEFYASPFGNSLPRWVSEPIANFLKFAQALETAQNTLTSATNITTGALGFATAVVTAPFTAFSTAGDRLGSVITQEQAKHIGLLYASAKQATDNDPSYLNRALQAADTALSGLQRAVKWLKETLASWGSIGKWISDLLPNYSDPTAHAAYAHRNQMEDIKRALLAEGIDPVVAGALTTDRAILLESDGRERTTEPPKPGTATITVGGVTPAVPVVAQSANDGPPSNSKATSTGSTGILASVTDGAQSIWRAGEAGVRQGVAEVRANITGTPTEQALIIGVGTALLGSAGYVAATHGRQFLSSPRTRGLLLFPGALGHIAATELQQEPLTTGQKVLEAAEVGYVGGETLRLASRYSAGRGALLLGASGHLLYNANREEPLSTGETAIAAAEAAYVAARVGPTVARAAAAASTAVVTGTMQGLATAVGTREWRAVQEAAEKLAKLRAEQAELTAARAAAEAAVRDARGTISELRARNRLATIDGKLASIGSQIEGYDKPASLFSRARHVPGVEAELSVARRALDQSSYDSLFAGRGVDAARMRAADSLQHAADVTTRAVDGTINATTRTLGIDAGRLAETAPRTTRLFGGLGRLVGKWGLRAVPVVGVGFTAYEIFGPSEARAGQAHRGGASLHSRLEADYKAGILTATEYTAISGLQAAYVASGIGGIVTGAIAEAGLASIKELGSDKLARYLPQSVIETVQELSIGFSALPQPDPGLASAASNAECNARRAATTAGRGMANARVSLCATVPSINETGAGESSQPQDLPSAGTDLNGNFVMGF